MSALNISKLAWQSYYLEDVTGGKSLWQTAQWEGSTGAAEMTVRLQAPWEMLS
jgi:hypothetical protein